jgi:SAM-dependent methyltransferase
MIPTDNFKDGLIYAIGRKLRVRGIDACQDFALKLGRKLEPKSAVNIGAGDTTRWDFAEREGSHCSPCADYNTAMLPFADNSFELVVNEQVIEHLHNTTWFIQELFRITKPGGHLLIATENLVSIPNRIMVLLGFAPFSTQSVCGRFIGGFKRGLVNNFHDIPKNHPCFAGVKGHVRVMTTRQVRELLESAGWIVLDKWGFCLDHYILFHCIKP